MSGKFWFWSLIIAILCGAIAGKLLSIQYLEGIPIF